MSVFSNMTLKLKITIISSISILLIQLIVSFLSIRSNSKKMFDDFNNESKIIIEELNGSLPNPLWNYNFNVAENIIKIKLKNNKFKGVKITEIASNKVVLEVNDTGETINPSEMIVLIDTLKNDGKSVWISELYFSDSPIKVKNRANIRSSVINTIILALIIACLISFLLQTMIFIPLQKTLDMLKDISEGEGDLTRRLDSKANDELGKLADSFNLFVEKIRKTISHVANDSNNLKDSSNVFASTSAHIATITKDISVQTDNVATSTLKAESQMSTLSQRTTDISVQVETIASAIEELNSSLTEVSQNCIKQSNVVEAANIDVGKSNNMMKELELSTVEISKISDVINDIADQTNLLALNATIEAASAGDAGKGFAVVASEVKELARKTADATKEIDNKIKSMNNIVESSAASISSIVAVIQEVNQISLSIANAVEEQSATVNDIAENISNTSVATSEVNTHTEETVTDLSAISKNIQAINSAMGEASNSVNSINVNAKNLNELTTKLDTLINQFIY